MNPFFCNAYEGLREDEFIGGCADDVVSATMSLASLLHICCTFADLEKFAGLRLNGNKIQIVPLGLSPILQSIEIFKDHIASHVPGLVAAKVSFCIEYLGVIIGLKCREKRWERAVTKFLARFRLISGAQRNLTFSVPSYNMFVVSVLSYIGQFFELPSHLHQRELDCLHKLFKFIPRTFPLAAFAHMHEVGLPRALMLRPYSLSMLYRFSRITVPDAFATASDIITGRRFADGDLLSSLGQPSKHFRIHPLFSTPLWDTAPIVGSLRAQFDRFQLPASTSFQSQRAAYKYFLEHMYPFSWSDFLVQRVQQTFPTLSSFSQEQLRFMLSFPISRLRRLRPVLAAAWLRFALNSLPSAHRLHDGKDDRCPWCLERDVRVSHILQCDMFCTTISFMNLGPHWRSLQTYLDQTAASRLAGSDAIVQSLGMHLPFTSFSPTLPLLPSDLPIVRSDELVSKLLLSSSQRSFKQLCILLYVRMHAFTSMRRALTDDTHVSTNIYIDLARHDLIPRIEDAVCTALRSLQ